MLFVYATTFFQPFSSIADFFGVLVEALQTDDLLSGEPFLRTPRYPGLNPQLDFFFYLKSTNKLSKMRRAQRNFVLRLENYIGISCAVAGTAWNKCWLT